MSKPALKKYPQFKNLLPYIESKLSEGYKYDGLIELLKEEHDLELTLGVFRNYLSNARKEIHIESPQKIPNISTSNLTQNLTQKIETEVQTIEPKIENVISNTVDDDEISPELLKSLEDDLLKQKQSFASKSLFDK